MVLSTSAISSSDSTGLARWLSNPACSASSRSGAAAKADTAMAGTCPPRMGIQLANPLDEIDAGHLRHRQIRDQYVGRLLHQQAECPLAAIRGDDACAVALQHAGHQLAGDRIIVDDQHVQADEPPQTRGIHCDRCQ